MTAERKARRLINGVGGIDWLKGWGVGREGGREGVLCMDRSSDGERTGSCFVFFCFEVVCLTNMLVICLSVSLSLPSSLSFHHSFFRHLPSSLFYPSIHPYLSHSSSLTLALSLFPPPPSHFPFPLSPSLPLPLFLSFFLTHSLFLHLPGRHGNGRSLVTRHECPLSRN